MKKLKHLIAFGLNKRIKSKAFVISNIIVCTIILIITLLPIIISSFDLPPEEIGGKVAIYDNTNTSLELDEFIKNNFNILISQTEVNNTVEFITLSDDSLRNSIFDQSDINSLIILNQSNDLISIELYDNGFDPNGNVYLNAILASVQRYVFSQQQQVDPNLVADTQINITYPLNSDNEMSAVISGGLSSIFIVPLFVLITIGIQFIGADIIEEKSTKAIEIIIASVKPSIHFIGKVSSIMIFMIMQFAIYIAVMVLGSLINDLIAGSDASNLTSWGSLVGGLGDTILVGLIITIIFTIFGALLYLVIGAFIASLAVNNEDYQQIQTPVMLILMTGYFASILAASFQSSELMMILSFIPFISPMVVPAAFITGSIGVVELIISLVILMVSVVIITILFAPAYRASILSYDQSKLVRRIINSFKQAKALRANQKKYLENNKE